MKAILALTFSFITLFGFSQKEDDSIYFPQEQLIHPECTNTDDKNACLEKVLEKQVLALLNEKKNLKTISKGEKDTLSIGFTLLITDKGLVNKESSNSSIRYSKEYKKIELGLDKILNSLPKFKIINRKSKDIRSKHYLNFKYQRQVVNKLTILRLIQKKEDYKGGTIETIPKYPGCDNKDNLESRKCFNQKVQNHIAKNFNYPREAQKKGIQGRVSIMFTIAKNGEITNIRHRGPDPILEKEAVRIIKLLPKLGPGTQNGKPVRVPFSIPIKFALTIN